MITKKQKKELTAILGNKYSESIMDELHRLGMRNRNGLPFSDSHIRNVMNGYQEQKNLEKVIFDLAAKVKEKNEREEARRNEILGIKKTEAATSVHK
ncbi:hypothetical protein [Flagellimonas sp.]|uniref:hypothetical protein n=1 Tax=Flagellimonas sp. TaxID=2058762 RepID=UPI003BAC7B70